MASMEQISISGFAGHIAVVQAEAETSLAEALHDWALRQCRPYGLTKGTLVLSSGARLVFYHHEDKPGKYCASIAECRQKLGTLASETAPTQTLSASASWVLSLTGNVVNELARRLLSDLLSEQPCFLNDMRWAEQRLSCDSKQELQVVLLYFLAFAVQLTPALQDLMVAHAGHLHEIFDKHIPPHSRSENRVTAQKRKCFLKVMWESAWGAVEDTPSEKELRELLFAASKGQCVPPQSLNALAPEQLKLVFRNLPDREARRDLIQRCMERQLCSTMSLIFRCLPNHRSTAAELAAEVGGQMLVWFMKSFVLEAQSAQWRAWLEKLHLGLVLRCRKCVDGKTPCIDLASWPEDFVGANLEQLTLMAGSVPCLFNAISPFIDTVAKMNNYLVELRQRNEYDFVAHLCNFAPRWHLHPHVASAVERLQAAQRTGDGSDYSPIAFLAACVEVTRAEQVLQGFHPGKRLKLTPKETSWQC